MALTNTEYGKAYEYACLMSINRYLTEKGVGPVDRATALFMQSFYRTWKGGATKREAFAEAQRRVREGYNPSPEYWAAFVLLD